MRGKLVQWRIRHWKKGCSTCAIALAGFFALTLPAQGIPLVDPPEFESLDLRDRAFYRVVNAPPRDVLEAIFSGEAREQPHSPVPSSRWQKHVSIQEKKLLNRWKVRMVFAPRSEEVRRLIPGGAKLRMILEREEPVRGEKSEKLKVEVRGSPSLQARGEMLLEPHPSGTLITFLLKDTSLGKPELWMLRMVALWSGFVAESPEKAAEGKQPKN